MNDAYNEELNKAVLGHYEVNNEEPRQSEPVDPDFIYDQKKDDLALTLAEFEDTHKQLMRLIIDIMKTNQEFVDLAILIENKQQVAEENLKQIKQIYKAVKSQLTPAEGGTAPLSDTIHINAASL